MRSLATVAIARSELPLHPLREDSRERWRFIQRSISVKKSAACLSVVSMLCGIAVAAGESNDFALPSDVACIERPTQPDFGPPSDCSGGPQPHNRVVMATALATANSSATVVPSMGSVVVVFDANAVQIVQHVGQLPERGRTLPKPISLLVQST